MKTRVVIEQARGMVMGLSPGLTAELIAQRIVERRSPIPNQPEGGTS